MNGTLSSNSTRDNSREIEILNRQINNIFEKLAEIERSERHVLGEKKDAIITLAKIYERQHELGEYKQPVNTICAHICNVVRGKGLLASERWIHDVLANIKDDDGNKKYIQVKFDPTLKKFEEIEALVENSIEEPELAKEDEFAISRIANKSLDELRDPQEIKVATEQEFKKAERLKSMARETAKRADLLKEKCERLGIEYEIIDDDLSQSGNNADEIPVISAVSENSGPSLTSNELKGLAGDILRAVTKVEKYKPEATMDKRFAEAIANMRKVWRGWIDEKHRKDAISWLHVAMDKQAHGKHAAATMHATILPDGTRRALTREQVGDKDELILQQAMNILAMQSDLAAMHSWYVNYPEKAIASRAKRLNPRLSNSA